MLSFLGGCNSCPKPRLLPLLASSHCAGMDDFPLSSIQDIKAALPVFKAAGVPLYVHAELALPDDAAVREPSVAC